MQNLVGVGSSGGRRATIYEVILLNKIPVLDKGYVALRGCSLNGEEMRAIEKDHYKGKINRQLWDVATLTLEIRCPLFVQLFFQQFNLQVINTVEKDVEYYSPDVSEMNTGDHSVDLEVSSYIKQTSESLTITSKAMEQDGVDRFMANIVMPISVYNTVLVSGSLNQWIQLMKKKTPAPISAYRDAIYTVAGVEWEELDLFIGKVDGKKKKATKAKERDRERVRARSDLHMSSEGESHREDKGEEV